MSIKLNTLGIEEFIEQRKHTMRRAQKATVMAKTPEDLLKARKLLAELRDKSPTITAGKK